MYPWSIPSSDRVQTGLLDPEGVEEPGTEIVQEPLAGERGDHRRQGVCAALVVADDRSRLLVRRDRQEALNGSGPLWPRRRLVSSACPLAIDRSYRDE